MPEQRTKDPMVRVFSLWEHKSEDGTKRFWSGIVGGVKYIMFRSNSNHPQAPMFDVYVAPHRKRKDTPARTADDNDDFRSTPAGSTQAEAAPANNPGDEELPF